MKEKSNIFILFMLINYLLLSLYFQVSRLKEGAESVATLKIFEAIKENQAGAESVTQINIAIISVLTLIAYHFSIGHDLPHISYLTRLDIFLMGSTIQVFAVLMEAALTNRFMSAKKLNLTLKIDL